jgi:hypothetical protein
MHATQKTAAHLLHLDNRPIKQGMDMAPPSTPCQSSSHNRFRCRYILADQPEGSKFVFSGIVPNFSGLNHLHYVSFNNHRFEGNAMLPVNLKVVRMPNNQLTGVFLPSDLQHLALVDLRNNKLSGAVNEDFTHASNLVALHLSGNSLTQMPRTWASASGQQPLRLHSLDLSYNNIAVCPTPCQTWACVHSIGPMLSHELLKVAACCCLCRPPNLCMLHAAAWAPKLCQSCVQDNLPPIYGGMRYLCHLRLSHNAIKGTLDDFSQAIPPASLLSVVELQNNNLEGTLIIPDIVKLAVFTSSRFTNQLAKAQRHLFDVSNNRLQGPIAETLLQVGDHLPLPQCIPPASKSVESTVVAPKLFFRD